MSFEEDLKHWSDRFKICRVKRRQLIHCLSMCWIADLHLRCEMKEVLGNRKARASEDPT